MRRLTIVLVGLASACGRTAADHEQLGDRAYAAGAYRDALAEYQLGVKAGPTPDLHAKSAAAALHTQDYTWAAGEYRALAEQDPAVKAGRLRVEVVTWWVEKGYMTFPKAPPAESPLAP